MENFIDNFTNDQIEALDDQIVFNACNILKDARNCAIENAGDIHLEAQIESWRQ